MKLLPGSMVTHKLRLVEKLRQGGMSTLWIADHLTLRARVAVKFVSFDRARDDPTLVARFMREASMSAQINSPHVVRPFDHGVTNDGTPYIVMELLEGMTLGDRLEQHGALDTSETATLIRQVCKALAHAHRLGIVHRDIKADNIFLVASEDDPTDGTPNAAQLFVKLLDFGLAKQTHPLAYNFDTSTGAMVGTPSYMSPEQALSKQELDHRADLWATAVVAYHAITGKLPFEGETLVSLCVAIANTDYAPVTMVRADLPDTLDQFFERAIHRDIDSRFQSANELANAFVDAVHGVRVAPPHDENRRPSPYDESADVSSKLAAPNDWLERAADATDGRQLCCSSPAPCCHPRV